MRRIIPTLSRAFLLPALILSALAVPPSGAWAQATPAPQPRAEDTPGFTMPHLRDALESLTRALTEVYKALPRYQAPRMLDNGDIVIPRAPGAPADPWAPQPAPTPAPAGRPDAIAA